MSGQEMHDILHQSNELTEIIPPQDVTLEEESPRNSVNVQLIAAVTVLILSVIIVTAVTFVYVSEVNIYADKMQYAIVVEAETVDTRIIVYRWPTKKIRNTGFVTENFLCIVKGPSLKTYKENPEAAANSLINCLNVSKEAIPKSHISKGLIYFTASSGLQLLEIENIKAATKILTEIDDLFRSLPYRFGSIHILTPKELGVCRWIATNYLNDILVEIHEVSHNLLKVFMKTIGTLDIGGSSTYITFIPKRNAKKFGAPVKLKLFGKKYKLYTYRYNCYGMVTAENRYLVNLYLTSGSKTIYESPCWPLGYNETISMKDLFESLCTVSKKPENYNPGGMITFIGTGNPAECKQLVYTLFDFKSCAGKSYCSFDGVNMPTIHGKFMAFTGFYQMARVLKLPTSFSVTKFNTTLWSFCTSTWALLKSYQMNDNEKPLNLRRYCFLGFLIYTLLIDGFKFTPEDWKRITFAQDVQGINVKWSLGYMLNVSNTIPSEIKEVRSRIPEDTLHTVFSVFLSIGVIGILVLCKVILYG